MLDLKLVSKATLYKVFMSDWLTCNSIACKTHAALEVNVEKISVQSCFVSQVSSNSSNWKKKEV